MKDMTVTAARLDKFLHFLNILMWIAMIAPLVALAFIAAFFLFHLDPAWVASGYHEVSVGFLSMTIGEGYAPTPSVVLLTAASQLVIVFITFFFVRKVLACFRKILKPVKEGLPFQDIVCQNLKKSALYVIIWGTLNILTQWLELFLVIRLYQLPSLLLSDKITRITFTAPFDLRFLFVAAVLLLLSYVFRYGESLQQLSDETL